MSRSAAEGLRMMQGGVDRTGFADMYESLGDPLARIRANREAARQQALLDAMMEVDDTEPGTGTNNVTDLIINDELFNMLSESAVDARGALGRGPNLSLPKKILKSGPRKGTEIYENFCYDIADAYVISPSLECLAPLTSRRLSLSTTGFTPMNAPS